MLKNVLIISLTTVLFLSCLSGNNVKRLSDEGFMFAMIYDWDNTPVSAVIIHINGRRIVDSDIQGRFILDDMEKGEYRIRLTKRGYETIEETFYFDPLSVLYFKMINAQQLATLAVSAMENTEYVYAENYINRALILEPNRPDILYLKSINYHLQGKNEDAIPILENLIRSGNASSAVIQLLEIVQFAE